MRSLLYIFTLVAFMTVEATFARTSSERFVEEDALKTDLRTMKFKGSVRRHITMSYYTQKDEQTGKYRLKDVYMNTDYCFDRNGMFTQRFFFFNGKLGSLFISEMNEAGKLSKHHSYTYKGGALESYHGFLYQYDRSGRAVRIVGRDLDGYIVNDYTLQYGKNGKLTETSGTIGKERNITATMYDDRGFLKSNMYRQRDGKMNSRVEYKTDDRGNVTEMVSETSVDGKTEIQRFSSQYDQAGNLISNYSSDGMGNPGVKNTFTYDDHGNMLSQVSVYGGKETSRVEFTYTFDSHGNVLEKASRHENGIVNVEKNIIEYW